MTSAPGTTDLAASYTVPSTLLLNCARTEVEANSRNNAVRKARLSRNTGALSGTRLDMKRSPLWMWINFVIILSEPISFVKTGLCVAHSATLSGDGDLTSRLLDAFRRMLSDGS